MARGKIWLLWRDAACGFGELRGVRRKHNPESLWPGICRLVMPEAPRAEWPWLTAEVILRFRMGAVASPIHAGSEICAGLRGLRRELDRDHPVWEALAPEREAQRRFSYRISQLLMPAIDLAQVVSAWQLAIRDPAQMNVFCTDRLALPKSAAQTLTPTVLEEARGITGF